MYADMLLRDSSIFIAPISDSLQAWILRRNFSSIFVLADKNTHKYCYRHLLETLSQTPPTHLFVIEPGESRKNLDTCTLIWSEMKKAGLDRNSLVINLGGGVVCDIGGFCAATWKRGVEFIHIPTTLLAMTDAAIGGKTGVDFNGIKNIIGVTKQPSAVFIDPLFLKTLPDRELKSGTAEVLKHAAISGELTAQWLHALTELDVSEPDWTEVLNKSVVVKAAIVQEDPEEKGLRMLLNMGHTIGHAIESCFLDSSEPFTHGEAIAIGMICEIFIAKSYKKAVSDSDVLIMYLLRIFELPQLDSEISEKLWPLMLQDKKNASGNVRIALPDAPHSMLVLNITKSDLENSIEYYNSLAG
jgi:3-dehydroquinate synthase